MRRRRYQIGVAHRIGTGALPVQLAENALDVAKRVAPVIVGPIAAAVVQRALDDETAPDLETVMRAETPVQGRKAVCDAAQIDRSEEHTSELQSLMRISYDVFCLKKKNDNKIANSQTISS